MKPKSENRPEESILIDSILLNRLYSRHTASVGLIDVRYSQKKYAYLIKWIKNRFPLSAHLLFRYSSGGDSTIENDSLILQNPPRSTGKLISHSIHNNQTVNLTVKNEKTAVITNFKSLTPRNRSNLAGKPAKSGLIPRRNSGESKYALTETYPHTPKARDENISHQVTPHNQVDKQVKWNFRKPGSAISQLLTIDKNTPLAANQVGEKKIEQKNTVHDIVHGHEEAVQLSQLPVFASISSIPKITTGEFKAVSLQPLILNASVVETDNGLKDNLLRLTPSIAPKPFLETIQTPIFHPEPGHIFNQQWLDGIGDTRQLLKTQKNLIHSGGQELSKSSGFGLDGIKMIWRNSQEKAGERPDSYKEEIKTHRTETYKIEPDNVVSEPKTKPHRLENKGVRFSKREWAQLIEALSQVVWKKLLTDFDRRGIRVWR